MKRAGGIAGLALLVVLSGCAADAPEAAAERPAAQQRSPQGETATPSPTPTEARYSEAEVLFLNDARLAQPDWSDSELLEAAYAYCDDGDDSAINSGIVFAADQSICLTD